MCYGIHRECPLKSLRPVVPIPHKHSFSDDNDDVPLSNSGPSSAANSSKQQRHTAFTHLPKDSLLVRDEFL